MKVQLMSVFAATNSGSHTVLSAAVEGGPAEAFNRKMGYTRHLPNEALDRPWFAVVRPDGTVDPRQYLFFGRIGYREHWCPKLPYLGKADVECPVRLHLPRTRSRPFAGIFRNTCLTNEKAVKK